MANPLYGQNKADNALDHGKSSVIISNAAKTLLASESGSLVLHIDTKHFNICTVKMDIASNIHISVYS